MISQCPNCKTRFVVSDAKLKIAGGSVRCGACMQVFSATDHQMTDQQNTSIVTSEEKQPIPISHMDITEERLNNLLSASHDRNHRPNEPDQYAPQKTDKDILQNDGRIEPSIESIVGFETPPIIDAPPIEMDFSAKPPYKNRLFGLIGVSLCFAFLLLFGLHWLLAHPQQFKDHPRWHVAYQLACQLGKTIIKCETAENEIIYQTQSLRIISHPEQENALLLETVIINMSKVPQPSPSIYLQFSNIKEEALDNFHFTADEYLHGELKGSQYLPPATPIHIVLKIDDPGPAAVNYSVELK
jgi:predicted Zn finger-like uncharacterized protein